MRRLYYCCEKALLLFYEKDFRAHISYYFDLIFQSRKTSGFGYYADELRLSLSSSFPQFQKSESGFENGLYGHQTRKNHWKNSCSASRKKLQWSLLENNDSGFDKRRLSSDCS